MPNILGQTIGAFPTQGALGGNGALEIIRDGDFANIVGGTTASKGAVKIDASKANTIYGNSDTVQPPAIVLIPQIKY